MIMVIQEIQAIVIKLKIMKKIIIILSAILFTNITLCQVNSNIISKTEFNSTKINDVSIRDIRSTNGNEHLITNLNLGTM